jgi:hypothetical protein
MKAVIMPKGSPTAQPRLAPTLVPMKMNNFTEGYVKQETHRGMGENLGGGREENGILDFCADRFVNKDRRPRVVTGANHILHL